MADRFWVGGEGTWDATSTTNWSATSGGSPPNVGGASAPTLADNVFFNSASNATAYAVTIGTNAAAADVTIVGPAAGSVTITSGATAVLNVYGSWSSAATGVAFSTTSGAALNFLATTTGKTITTNNIGIGVMAVTFNGVGGGWTLGSNFTVTTIATTITAGAFSTGNFTFNGAAISSSGSGVRSVTLGSSILNLTGTNAWTFTITTNLTFNCNTSIITCTSTSPTFAGGGQTFATVNFTSAGASTRTITGGNTFTNLSFTSRTSDGLNVVTFDSNQTISGTLTLGAGNTAVRRMFVKSSSQWTQRTLTVETIATLADVDFQDIVAAGASGTWTGTRIGDCKNNSNITFTTAKTVFLSSTSGVSVGWNDTCWATSSNGTPSLNNFPLAQDTAIIDDAGTTAGNGFRTGSTVTLSSGWNIGTLTSTRTSAYNINQGNQDPEIYGNLTLSSGITFVGLGSPTLQFSGYGTTQTITSNGKTILQNNITVKSPGGTVRLLDALTLSYTATSTSAIFVLSNGTLDLNEFTLTPAAFSSTGSGVRTIAFGSTGKIVTAGGAGTSQTVFTTSTSTNLTVTGSANVECFLTSGYSNTLTTRTISPGTSNVEANTFNISLTGGGVDTVAVANTSNFRDLNTSGHGAGGVLFLGTTFTSYGNLVLGTGTTFTTSNPTSHIKFASTSGTKTITTNGVAFNKALTFEGIGGTWAVQDALSISSGTVTLTDGTLKLKSGAINDISTFATTGTNQKFLQSTTPGTQTTLRTANTGLNDTLTFDLLTLQDINANTSPDTTIYYAGLNSISNGNVTGWTFTRGDFLQMF